MLLYIITKWSYVLEIYKGDIITRKTITVRCMENRRLEIPPINSYVALATKQKDEPVQLKLKCNKKSFECVT